MTSAGAGHFWLSPPPDASAPAVQPQATPSLQPLILEVSQWDGASLPQLREQLHQLSGHNSASKNRHWLRKKIHSLALSAGYDVSADLGWKESPQDAPRAVAGGEAGDAAEAGGVAAKAPRMPKPHKRHAPGLINGEPVVELEHRTRPRCAPRRFDDGYSDLEESPAFAGAGGHAGSMPPPGDRPALKRKRSAGRSRGGDKAYRKAAGAAPAGGLAPGDVAGPGVATSPVFSRLKSTSMGRLTRMHPVRRKPLSGGTVGGYPAQSGCQPRSAGGAAAAAAAAVAPLASMRLACGTVLSPGDDVFVLTPQGLRHLHTCPLCSHDTTTGDPAARAGGGAAPPPPGEGDELLECDKCLRGFHLACLNLPAIPDGDWTCADCCLAAANASLWAADADGAAEGEPQCEDGTRLSPHPTPPPPLRAPPACPPRVIIDDMDRVDAGLLHLAHVEALWWDAAQRAVLFRARWYHCCDPAADSNNNAATLAPEATATRASPLLALQADTPPQRASQQSQGGGAAVRWWVPGMGLPLREVALCPPGTSDVAYIGSVLRRAHVVPPDQAAKAARDAAAEGKPLPVVCHRGYDPRLKRFTPLRR